MRERAMRGYSLNPEKNKEALREDSEELLEVWDWSDRLEKTTDGSELHIGGVDYGGQGVQAVINDMTSAR
ncbi:hypothetical protein HKX48_004449, partial [Thoreauomyces humboldtii]